MIFSQEVTTDDRKQSIEGRKESLSMEPIKEDVKAEIKEAESLKLIADTTSPSENETRET